MTGSVLQIGFGAIGRIYTGHLLSAFEAVWVHDVREGVRSEIEDTGAVFASDLRQAVAGVWAVLVALPDPQANRAVLHSDNGLLAVAAPGTVVLDVSTIDPDTARANHATARASGLHYVEAPVSGGEPMSAGVDGARAGNVTFMSGSDPESFEKALPLMRVLGAHPMLLGPAGTGSTVKLISNYISGLNNLVAAEALALGRAAGLDLELLLRTFAHTDANSYWLFNYLAPRLRENRYEPGFSVDLQHKDLRLCEDMARALKVAMPLNAVGLTLYRMLQGQGRGGNDLADAVNLLCELSGRQPYREDR